MVNTTKIINNDLNHIWHPCMQMKDFEQSPPVVVFSAQGSYLETNHGRLIDGISSWWCKSLGHGHPAVINAIQKQLSTFEHVIAANTTHEALAELGEKLAAITRNQHLFFASDGSCAVEIALKLALHAQKLLGKQHRKTFISLENSYHGETIGALSVSDLGIYKEPYNNLGLSCYFIKDVPYVSGIDDPRWHDASSEWESAMTYLEQIKDETCAVIVEPILQGAGGMRCYSADFLKKLTNWAQSQGIYVIVDEIMTGIGRTGHWLASEYAEIKPDLICLSKGLTSGSIPLSCVSIDHAIYELFYDDYESGKSFLHSHTHSGNALAISAALATIKAIEEEGLNQKASLLGQKMLNLFQEINDKTGKLSNIRSIGAMVAADLEDLPNQRVGFKFYQQALKQGAFLRPLGKTLYWLPPLNTDEKTIMHLAEITLNSIYAIYKMI
ncbi:adenosylmethionine-8-amino-7-oxononanoate aminotransferase [Legionella busanensis]|uniref:Adenosylmethionine-8-amino-7-oxononanoate aminotransferase n=1 Tax=Legionella busanensis TaxID=190655 RepID=A0A378JT69_9GAMM|nr:adenosylmethionine--8-amino-7-oxononanoate transaminase [Legionella busanensis]STX51372.1 adenosylmethionine-8-amino-7-oxononanoate aminotransferase [Legionella busanensis]